MDGGSPVVDVDPAAAEPVISSSSLHTMLSANVWFTLMTDNWLKFENDLDGFEFL